MRRLLASRDLKRKRRRIDAAAVADGDLQGYEDEDDDDDIDEELDPMTYRDSWTQTRLQEEEPAERGAGLQPAQQAGGDRDVLGNAANSMSDYDAYYRENEDEEPYFEGVGSSGFSGVVREEIDGGGAGAGGSAAAAAGRSGQRQQQWERVSGRPRPRQRPPAAASRRFEGEVEGDGDYYDSGGRRARGEANFRSGREGRGGGGMTRYGGGEVRDDSRMTEGGKKGR